MKPKSIGTNVMALVRSSIKSKGYYHEMVIVH